MKDINKKKKKSVFYFHLIARIVLLGIGFTIISIGFVGALALFNGAKSNQYKNVCVLILAGWFDDKNEELSATSLARVDAASKLIVDEKSCYIVCGGGINRDGRTEAELMKERLCNNGIDEDRVLIEETATNTFLSMKISKELINAQGKENIVIVSSSTHMFRCLLLVKYFGYENVKMLAVPEVNDKFIIYRYIRECGAIFHDIQCMLIEKLM